MSALPTCRVLVSVMLSRRAAKAASAPAEDAAPLLLVAASLASKLNAGPASPG